MTTRILIVDDDLDLRHLLRDLLKRHGYEPLLASEGVSMWRQLDAHDVDCIILDIMLPGDDGLSLCQQLRQRDFDMPVIMLSAAGDETDRVVGLEVGADDYLPKPFSQRELLARIKAVLRRAKPKVPHGSEVVVARPILQVGDWLFHQDQRLLASPEAVAIPLSTAEFKLLEAFVAHPKQVLSRDQLLTITVGREAQPFDRAVDVTVGRLRKKFGDNPKEATMIETVRGGGYRLLSDVSVYRGEWVHG